MQKTKRLPQPKSHYPYSSQPNHATSSRSDSLPLFLSPSYLSQCLIQSISQQKKVYMDDTKIYVMISSRYLDSLQKQNEELLSKLQILNIKCMQKDERIVGVEQIAKQQIQTIVNCKWEIQQKDKNIDTLKNEVKIIKQIVQRYYEEREDWISQLETKDEYECENSFKNVSKMSKMTQTEYVIGSFVRKAQLSTSFTNISISPSKICTQKNCNAQIGQLKEKIQQLSINFDHQFASKMAKEKENQSLLFENGNLKRQNNELKERITFLETHYEGDLEDWKQQMRKLLREAQECWPQESQQTNEKIQQKKQEAKENKQKEEFKEKAKQSSYRNNNSYINERSRNEKSNNGYDRRNKNYRYERERTQKDRKGNYNNYGYERRSSNYSQSKRHDF